MGLNFNQTGRLDWRKIASFEPNALRGPNILTKLSNGEVPKELEDLVVELTSYSAAIEFPLAEAGLTKVLGLTQSLCSLFFENSLKQFDEVKKTEITLKNLQKEYQESKVEISKMKTAIVELKKELKKRAELLTNTQTELLGAENKDEFDQCPYCNKRFLTAVYLYAHLQRRHQGLPMDVVFGNKQASQLFQSYGCSGQNVTNGYPRAETPPACHCSRNVEASGKVQKDDLDSFGSPSSPGVLQEDRDSIDKSCQPQTIKRAPFYRQGNDGALSRKETGTQTPTILDEQSGGDGVALANKKLEQPEIGFQFVTNFFLDQILHNITEKCVGGAESQKMENFSLKASKDALTSPKKSRTSSPVDSVSECEHEIATKVPHPFRNVLDAVDHLVKDGKPEEAINVLKEDWEKRWDHLSLKVYQTGIQELKNVLRSELKQFEHGSLKTLPEESAAISPVPCTQVEVPKVDQGKSNVETVEASTEPGPQASKESTILPELTSEANEWKIRVEAKMAAELENLKQRISSQENFWQKRFQSMERVHEQELENLRSELEAKVEKNEISHVSSIRKNLEVVEQSGTISRQDDLNEGTHSANNDGVFFQEKEKILSELSKGIVQASTQTSLKEETKFETNDIRDGRGSKTEKPVEPFETKIFKDERETPTIIQPISQPVPKPRIKAQQIACKESFTQEEKGPLENIEKISVLSQIPVEKSLGQEIKEQQPIFVPKVIDVSPVINKINVAPPPNPRPVDITFISAADDSSQKKMDVSQSPESSGLSPFQEIYSHFNNKPGTKKLEMVPEEDTEEESVKTPPLKIRKHFVNDKLSSGDCSTPSSCSSASLPREKRKMVKNPLRKYKSQPSGLDPQSSWFSRSHMHAGDETCNKVFEDKAGAEVSKVCEQLDIDSKQSKLNYHSMKDALNKLNHLRQEKFIFRHSPEKEKGDDSRMVKEFFETREELKKDAKGAATRAYMQENLLTSVANYDGKNGNETRLQDNGKNSFKRIYSVMKKKGNKWKKKVKEAMKRKKEGKKEDAKESEKKAGKTSKSLSTKDGNMIKRVNDGESKDDELSTTPSSTYDSEEDEFCSSCSHCVSQYDTDEDESSASSDEEKRMKDDTISSLSDDKDSSTSMIYKKNKGNDKAGGHYKARAKGLRDDDKAKNKCSSELIPSSKCSPMKIQLKSKSMSDRIKKSDGTLSKDLEVSTEMEKSSEKSTKPIRSIRKTSWKDVSSTKEETRMEEKINPIDEEAWETEEEDVIEAGIDIAKKIKEMEDNRINGTMDEDDRKIRKAIATNSRIITPPALIPWSEEEDLHRTSIEGERSQEKLWNAFNSNAKKFSDFKLTVPSRSKNDLRSINNNSWDDSECV